MTFENTAIQQPTSAAQSGDTSAAGNNNSEFLQQEAFLIAKEIKAGDIKGALQEVENLRAGSTSEKFSTLLSALNSDVQADLKDLGFPGADQFAFSNPNDSPDMRWPNRVRLNTPDGHQTAYFDVHDKEYGLYVDSVSQNSDTWNFFDDNTGLLESKDVYQKNGPETDYQYDKSGAVQSIHQYDHGQEKIIDPTTGKETILSRTENFFHGLIKDTFDIDI